MASPRVAWGIDVGNRALKAVRLVRDGDNIRLDDVEVIEHAQILSASGDNRDDLIRASIAELASRKNIKGVQVAIAIPGNSSFARTIKLPPVEKKKIPEIVKFEAVQQIPFPLDDVEWAYQVFEQDDSPEAEVGIFAIRKDVVNEIVGTYTAQNLNVQLVQTSPVAAYNAAAYENRTQDVTMIVDVGADNTDLVIVNGDTIWLRSLSVGGSNFTESLVRAFKLDFAEAEKQKRSAGTSKYAKQMFQAMRSVFDDLVGEIQRSIGFYASTHRDVRIAKILAMGGTFQLPGLQKYLEQRLSLPVERLDQLSAGSPTDTAVAAKFTENLLSLGTAYGLAVQLLGDGKINSSLLPASIRREKMWADKTKWFATAAALAIAGSGVAFASVLMQESAYGAASSQRDDINRIVSEAKNLDSKWSEIESAGSAEKAQFASLTTLLKNRSIWPQVLQEAATALPLPEAFIKQDAAELKKVPRSQREVFQIESITSTYRPDMAAVLAAPNFKQYATQNAAPSQSFGGFGGFGGDPAFAGEGGGSFSAPPPPTPSADGSSTGAVGFILTIRGITPNQNLGFVSESYLKKLLASSVGPSAAGREFYFARAEIADAKRFREVPDRMQRMTAEFAERTSGVNRGAAQGGGFGGFGGAAGEGAEGGFAPPGNFGGPRPGGDNDIAAFLDPLTQEDRRLDYDITLVVAVVLGPPPPPAAPAEGQAPAPGN